jgi:hypothetical protein
MARKKHLPDERPEPEITEQELEAQRGLALPDREALSTIDANVAIPADPSIAADVLSGAEVEEEPAEPDRPEGE